MSEDLLYLSESGDKKSRRSGAPRRKAKLDEIMLLLDPQTREFQRHNELKKHYVQVFMEFVGFQTTNTLELISQLREGVSYSSFKNLSDFTSIPAGELSSFISISASTLNRRRKEGKLHPDETEKVYRLASLIARATEVLNSREEANHWLQTPKKALGGQIPLELADTEVGADEVRDLLGRIEHGVFA